MATYQEYLSTIQTNNYRTKAKIEFLRRRDESVERTMYKDIISGSISITNTNGVRRTVNLLLDNSNKEYLPNEYNLWINSQFNFYIGIECEKDDYYYVPMGSFVLQNPSLSSNDYTISISGVDKFSLLNGSNKGILKASYLVNIGENIPTVIKDALNHWNILKKPLIHSAYANEVTPFKLIEPRGSNAKEFILKLQSMLSSNVYFDPTGRFIFEPDFNDSTKTPIHHFKAGDYHYKGSTYDLRYDEVKNYILVIGSNISGTTYEAVVQNQNLQSPTRVQLIGEIVDIIEDPNIPSIEYAQYRGEYELKRQMMTASSVTIDSIFIPHLDVDKIGLLTEPNFDLSEERFLISDINWTFGLNGGEGTVNMSKTSDLLIS